MTYCRRLRVASYVHAFCATGPEIHKSRCRTSSGPLASAVGATRVFQAASLEFSASPVEAQKGLECCKVSRSMISAAGNLWDARPYRPLDTGGRQQCFKFSALTLGHFRRGMFVLVCTEVRY